MLLPVDLDLLFFIFSFSSPLPPLTPMQCVPHLVNWSLYGPGMAFGTALGASYPPRVMQGPWRADFTSAPHLHAYEEVLSGSLAGHYLPLGPLGLGPMAHLVPGCMFYFSARAPHPTPPACSPQGPLGQGWRYRRTFPMPLPLALPRGPWARAGVTEELKPPHVPIPSPTPPTAGGRQAPPPWLMPQESRTGALSWHVGNHPDLRLGML